MTRYSANFTQECNTHCSHIWKYDPNNNAVIFIKVWRVQRTRLHSLTPSESGQLRSILVGPAFIHSPKWQQRQSMMRSKWGNSLSRSQLRWQLGLIGSTEEWDTHYVSQQQQSFPRILTCCLAEMAIGREILGPHTISAHALQFRSVNSVVWNVWLPTDGQQLIGTGYMEAKLVFAK